MHNFLRKKFNKSRSLWLDYCMIPKEKAMVGRKNQLWGWLYDCFNVDMDCDVTIPHVKSSIPKMFILWPVLTCYKLFIKLYYFILLPSIMLISWTQFLIGSLMVVRITKRAPMHHNTCPLYRCWCTSLCYVYWWNFSYRCTLKPYLITKIC